MSGDVKTPIGFVCFMGNKVADAQEFCAEKNVWFGRLVVFLTVPVRTLLNLSLPVVFVAEKVIQAALNVLGAILKTVTCGRLAKRCTLANAGNHILKGLYAGTIGLIKNTLICTGLGLVQLLSGLSDPKDTWREKKQENLKDEKVN